MVEQTDQVTWARATTQVARPRHLRRQDIILRSKHQQLREKLNFRAIYPYLNERGLLPYCDQSTLVDETLTEQEKIDTIFASLMKCNKDNYLMEFIDCLKRSEYGTGEGHLELAQSLEAAYEAEADNDDDSDCIQTDSTLRIEQIENSPYGKGSYHPAAATETDVRYILKKKKHYLICGCVFVLLPFLVMIITLGIFSYTPSVNNDPGSDMVRPLLTNRPRDGDQTRLLEVDFGTDPVWVSNADFQIEDCTGTILIIQGAQCHDLPRRVIEQTDPSRNLYFAYLLPGSVVNITIADTITDSEVQIWTMNSEGWKLTDFGINLDSCNDPPPGSSCFLAQSKAGQTIQQEIKKADFYFYFTDPLPSPSDAVGFTYVAEQYLYNLTEIRQFYSPTETAIIRDRLQRVTISPAFDFQRKCVMLSSSCPRTQSHTVTIGNLKRRMDILIFPGVGGIIVLLVAISVLSVYIALIVRPHLKKRYKSKVVG